jgi:hypothetical protein
MCNYCSNIPEIFLSVLLYCIVFYIYVYCDYFYALRIVMRVYFKFYSQNIGGNLKYVINVEMF